MSKNMRTDVLSLAVPVNPDSVDRSLTAVQIQDQIDAITATLRGPLSNIERGFLTADRREMRARLALTPRLAGRVYPVEGDEMMETKHVEKTYCYDERHETPCMLPCAACAIECTQDSKAD